MRSINDVRAHLASRMKKERELQDVIFDQRSIQTDFERDILHKSRARQSVCEEVLEWIEGGPRG